MTVPPVHLDDASVEAIARRVVELVGSECGSKDWIDVAEVARRLSVSRDYVYRHANELGARRVGDGSKSRLRFDPAEVAKRLSGPGSEESHHKVKPVRSVRSKGDVPLLPVAESNCDGTG